VNFGSGKSSSNRQEARCSSSSTCNHFAIWFQLALFWSTQRAGDVAPCAALWLGQLTAPEVYVNAERVLPCRDSARNPKSQQNGKDDLVAQRLQ